MGTFNSILFISELIAAIVFLGLIGFGGSDKTSGASEANITPESFGGEFKKAA